MLDKCHRIRNLAEDEGQFDVDGRLLADLLAVTKAVRQGVEKLDPVPKSAADFELTD